MSLSACRTLGGGLVSGVAEGAHLHLISIMNVWNLWHSMARFVFLAHNVPIAGISCEVWKPSRHQAIPTARKNVSEPNELTGQRCPPQENPASLKEPTVPREEIQCPPRRSPVYPEKKPNVL